MKIREILAPGNETRIDSALDKLIEVKKELEERYFELLGNGESQELDDVQREIADINDEIHEVAQQIVGPHSALWHQITTECSQALEAIKNTGHWIMRGVKGSPGIMFQGASRLVRNPRDSDIKTSIMFNHCLTELGFKARRDNSIFVTAYRPQASEFGPVYLIFPKNGFDYTYANQGDMTLNESDMKYMYDTKLLDKLQQYLKTLQSDPKTSLQADISRAGNAVGNALFYWIMTFSTQEVAQFEKETGVNLDWRKYIDLEKFQRKYKPANRDLEYALMASMEIYVRGEYIALQKSVFDAAVSAQIKSHR